MVKNVADAPTDRYGPKKRPPNDDNEKSGQ